MALTNCHECGKEVADTASKCPYCGCNHPAVPAATKNTIGLLVVIGLAVMVAGLWMCM